MENQVTNNNDEIEIDLGEIFHLILSRLGVIILSGIILGVISIIGTMLLSLHSMNLPRRSWC